MTDLVLEKVRHLAGTLNVLRGRVREAVAGEVGRAVADAVADVLTSVLSGHRAPPPRYAAPRTGYGRPDWDDPGGDGWHDEPSHTRRADRYRADDTDEAGPDLPTTEAALALAVTASRWWLARRNSPWQATGLGLAAGAALLTGGPSVRTALAAVWAVQRLLAATDALGDGAKALDRI